MQQHPFKLFVFFSFNNVHMTLCSLKGKTLFKISSGFINKRHKLKPKTIQQIIDRLKLFVKLLDPIATTPLILIFKGSSKIRFNVLRELFNSNLSIASIFYVSLQPFNGCRLKKRKRL